MKGSLERAALFPFRGVTPARYSSSVARTQWSNVKGAGGRFVKQHGASQAKTSTYQTWLGMMKRCYHQGAGQYPDYGGRGITVCERWRTFENFLTDVGERPAGRELDRYPNNNGNYEPGNVRWATPAENSHNRRSTKLEEHEPAQIRWLAGLGYTHQEIANLFEVSRSTVSLIVKGTIWKNGQTAVSCM